MHVMPARYTYLGPEASFTEAALRTLPAVRDTDVSPSATVPAALAAVRAGQADAAMVPLENSVEGGVNVTLDELAAGEPLHIVREVQLPVEFRLLARPGTALGDVKRLITHPHALAQCRRWLADHLPSVRAETGTSTSAAAAEVSDPTAPFDAAIASPLAAARYGLVSLADDIGEHADAVTRFVLVQRPGPQPAPSGADRTSLVAFIGDDHPGALLEILSEFAIRGVNLTRIESRPTGAGLGRYCFCIDCAGHLAEARMGEALMGLRRVCPEVRFLGSYPRADGLHNRVRHGTGDQDFAAAARWLREIRSIES